MLTENSKLIPISIYAETKLMGEVKIEETFEDYIILREALLIGFGLNHSRNNFQLMYENLKNGKPVRLFTDQFRTPLALNDSAKIIGDLINKNVSNEIFNLAGSERVSRSEIGEIVCDKTGFHKNLIIKTTMEEVGLPYKVKDVSLSTEKLNAFDIKPLSLHDSIKKIIEQYGQ
jgi:dTDP-4-dehydrorhamnose reductase